ncbi:MAG: VanW family protein [Oscillospiraceae bacterium]|nr:VanW family protein [Oscillospiraceae bacterium]
MNRDREEFDYLADLEDPNGDNFVPSDYNTQDMRNINEKVNRILYGENSKNSSQVNDDLNSYKNEEEQVDINLSSSRSNSSKDINSFSNPNKESDEGYIYDTYNRDKKQPKAEKSKEKKPKKKKIIVASIISATVVLCAVMVLVIQAVVAPKDNLLADIGLIEKVTDPVVVENTDGDFIFAKGCKVSGVEIGGMTVAEAKKALTNKELEARPEMNITVSVDDEVQVYTQDNFTFTYDTDKILEEEKQFSEKLSQGATFPTAEDKNGVEYFPDQIKKISATLNESSVEKLTGKINKKYDKKAKNARVAKFNPDAKNMFTFTEGTNGRNLDEESLLSQLNSIVEEGNSTGVYTGTVSEYTEVVKPKVNIDFLEENMVLLAQWQTISTNGANGNQNMKVSLEACNGSIIDPGEVWSFNDCTGDSNDTANGYAPAGVIIDGSYTDGVGGGICQSSTTIYNAAVRSNLTIYERHNHTYPSSYAFSGFDAAIDYGNFDLKLKNDSKYQVFLACYMEGTTLYASFYGIKPDSYDVIDTYSENYSIGSSSYRAKSFRVYKDAKGKTIDKEELPGSYYSLENGHSVQTADTGGTDYKHNIHISAVDRPDNSDKDEDEKKNSSSSSVSSTVSQNTVPASSDVPTTTKKPKETKPASSASSKPESSSSKKPSSSSASSKPASSEKPATSAVSSEPDEDEAE